MRWSDRERFKIPHDLLQLSKKTLGISHFSHGINQNNLYYSARNSITIGENHYNEPQSQLNSYGDFVGRQLVAVVW